MGNLSPGTAEARTSAHRRGHFKYQMKVRTMRCAAIYFRAHCQTAAKAAARIYNEKINDASRHVHMRAAGPAYVWVQ